MIAVRRWWCAPRLIVSETAARSWPPHGHGSISTPNAGCMSCHLETGHCFGERSPLSAAIRAGASVLLLGVGYDKCTALHLAEARAAPDDAPVLAERGWIRTQDGRREVSYTKLAFDGADFPVVGRAFEETCDPPVAVGNGEVRVADAALLVNFATRWIREYQQEAACTGLPFRGAWTTARRTNKSLKISPNGRKVRPCARTWSPSRTASSERGA